MKHLALVAALVLAFEHSLIAADTSAYQTTKLAGTIYELTADGGGYPVKVIASVGTDGLLIIDSGEEENGTALANALNAFSKGLPKVIINTHSHIEHLGGNVVVGAGCTIIGHANLRDRYVNGLYVFNGIPESALPNVTFTDSLTVFFNGEEIKLLAFPGAHDNSDIIVWFTKSRIVCTGALCNGHHFPSIDGELGDILKYPETVARVISMLPEDVRIVPGHSPDCTMKEFRGFHDMLVQTSDIVRSELAKGKTLEQLQEEKVLADWKSWELYVDCDGWIRYWANGIQHPRLLSTKNKVYAPIYHAIMDNGVDSALGLYQRLKLAESERYEFEERTPLYIGRRLSYRGDDDGAIKFLNLCILEYPQTEAAAISEVSLGNVYWQQGKKGVAKEHYRKYLECFPHDAEVLDRINEAQSK